MSTTDGPASGRRRTRRGRTFGFLGEPRVNVLEVNLALERRREPRRRRPPEPVMAADEATGRGVLAAHAAQARPAQDLPRLRAGRRQDLQHAGRGAPALLPRRGRRRRLRRDPRPQRDRGARRGTRAPPPQANHLPRQGVRGARHRRGHRAPPEWVLVDELAHTNVPGARHEKRWQSVEEIQAAGINVITTVNIQHFESLNDTVFDITGVRVQETLPDAVLDTGRRGGAGRPHDRRAPQPPAARRRLRRRQDPRSAGQLLQAREPRRPARAGPAQDRRGSRRVPRAHHRREKRHCTRGPPRSESWCASGPDLWPPS